MNTAKLKALHELYSPRPVPTCRLCGAEMSAQRISGSRITYGCTGATYDNTGCHYAPGRNIADEHYEQSTVVVDDFSDPDVIELIAALEAEQKLNAELDDRLLRYAGIATRRAEHVAELEKRVAELGSRTVKLPAFDGYKEDIVRELQGAFRIACGDAGINLETGGEA